jgi:DNA-binding transcriptional regulator LsrR (DeoR family)
MISMYTDGISKVEIAQQLGLPEAKISEVIRDLRSPEFTDALLDHV